MPRPFVRVLGRASSRLFSTALSLLLAASPLPAADPAAAPIASAEASAQPVGTAAQQQLWMSGLQLATAGKFDKAASQIEEVVADGVKDARVKKVDTWLQDYMTLMTARLTRAKQDCEKYVGWVQEDLERQKLDNRPAWWRLAILDCARAYNSTMDKDALAKEPWFTEAVAGAVKAAKEYESDNKWLSAARIYGPLADMFPFDKDYREAMERCQSHVRLELLYSEDADWQSIVKGVVPEMATDAFRRIEESYLTVPSFQEAATAGIEQLLRMARTPKLQQVFPALKDKDRSEEFCDRLEARLRQVKRADKMDAEDLVDLFERILDINREYGLFPQNVLIHEFMHGALQPLDPFSDMLWPSDILEFNKHTQGRFSGVGIQIRKDPGEPIKVVSPLDDTPAYRKGIQPGDLITEINGEPTEKITINQAVQKITGPPGTTVTLTIKRIGVDKPFPVKLERQEITIFTIKGYERNPEGEWKYMIDPDLKIGYVRMTNFTEGTIDELQEIVSRLSGREGMKGLIFDLRGNPGGPLKSAVDVTDLFLDGNKRIVSTKDRQGQEWSKSSSNDEHFTDFPMIILVDETTASASEIVSGALQVHGRALILGERSFGKGSVQQVLPLNRNNAAFLKLTTAHYYLPNDRCLHREVDSRTWGVDPDVEVKLVPKEFVKARELQLEKDILKGKGQQELSEETLKAVTGRPSTQTEEGEEDASEDTDKEKATATAESDDDEIDEKKAGISRKDENEFPAVDPQIEAALTLMRIRLETGVSWPQPAAQVAVKPAENNPAATALPDTQR